MKAKIWREAEGLNALNPELRPFVPGGIPSGEVGGVILETLGVRAGPEKGRPQTPLLQRLSWAQNRCFCSRVS